MPDSNRFQNGTSLASSAKQPAPTRLLIADPQRVVAEAITDRFRREREIIIEGVATTPEEVRALEAATSPDVLLLEVDFEGCGAFGLCSEIAAHSPDVRFVFLTTNDADVSLKAALKLSAGYLLKTDSLDEVVAAICGMAGGSPPFSASVEQRIRFDRLRDQYVLKVRPPVTDLTTRQVEVLRHIARGRTTREIADDLQLTPNGVESQKHRIMHKLKIYDRVGLARYAIREGLLRP